MVTTKGKRLTKAQKVEIYDIIEGNGAGDSGFAESVENGDLNAVTKGTAFGKLVKAAYKAYQAVKKAADKQGVTDSFKMEDLRNELEDEETTSTTPENTTAATV